MNADYHQTVIEFNPGQGFHQMVSFCLNPGMDTKSEVRRQRLALLIDTQFGGNQTEFAERVGKRQSAVSDMLRGVKSFGEKVARDIERKAGLAELWLDGLAQDEGPATQQIGGEVYISAASPEDLVRQLRERGDADVLKILELLVANRDKIGGH